METNNNADNSCKTAQAISENNNIPDTKSLIKDNYSNQNQHNRTTIDKHQDAHKNATPFTEEG